MSLGGLQAKGAVLIAGTSSDVGKSVIVAGICRWLHRQGVSVAPFKAQNMSLNAAVSADGGEIGRAQAAQAAACGVAAEVAMNPVLIKPTGDRQAQVVVLGQPRMDIDAAAYQDLTPTLQPIILEALAGLRRRFDVVVCEGAGGIAEINLRSRDLANLGLARAARLPVVLVGDIDRGGVFASLFGSLALLDPADQAVVRAVVINKFRGDPSLLAPGLDTFRWRTGRPVLGVLPWLAGIELDGEDSLALRDAGGPAVAGDRLGVAVVRLPRIANFTDLDPLAAEPGVDVSFTASPAAVAAADLVVLPGTKATVEDLAWLRCAGLAGALAARARRGDPLLGVCGGYQMLGGHLSDGVESHAGEVAGLGLLPVATAFEATKVLGRPCGTAPGFGGTAVCGYEIHHGRVCRHGGDPVFLDASGDAEGCQVGEVFGTSWHGVFESDGFRRAFLGRVASVRGRAWAPGSHPFAALREARLDALADLVAANVDQEALLGIIEGSGGDLPVVTTGLVGG